ncbi:MAG: hypothetical protein Q8M19_21895 [Reyranella sp.]|nr:hypothetical protein [Reyranella sp.]
MQHYFTAGYLLFALFLIIGAWRLRRRSVRVGPAAGAMMTELLDDRRRAAIEIIREERTGERDVEDRDGNLPDLAAGSSVTSSGSQPRTSRH